MNEIAKQKNLYGFGGWLVLFQIHIFSTLAGVVQSVFAFVIMGLVMRGDFFSDLYGFNGYNPMAFFEPFLSPYMYAYMAAIFVLTLMIVIFFYRKKILFRTLFIIQSAVSLIGLVLYFVFVMGTMYTVMFDGFMEVGRAIMIFTGVMSMLPTVGIAVAFIIALYKSQRVKNTFN